MLLVYGDESMDQTQDRVCAVAGVIGTEDQWNWIEPIWIDRTGGIPFHANDCEGNWEDFAAKDGEDRNEAVQRNKDLYRDLTILLAKSGLGGFASVIDLAAQRRAFPSPYDPPLYYQGLMDVIEAMRNAAADRNDIAKITFDNRKESQFNASVVYAYLQESGLYWSNHLDSKIEFESSRKNPRIQVADLFAREAMKKLDNALVAPAGKDPRVRRSWEALNATRHFEVKIYGEKYFSGLTKKMEHFGRITGVTENDYAEWIGKKRVPRCHTSYLQFLTARRKEMTGDQLEEFDEIFRE